MGRVQMIPNMHIRAVIFDWGNVLVEPVHRGMITDLASAFKTPEKEMVAVWRSLALGLMRGELDARATMHAIASAAGSDMDVDPSLLIDSFTRHYKPREEMFEIARHLFICGYKTALLTNCEWYARTYLEAHDPGCFHEKIYSCVERLVKPDQAIYELALDRLGLPAIESVFIDDREENVETAKRLGMAGIHYRSPEQVLEELRTLFVRI